MGLKSVAVVMSLNLLLFSMVCAALEPAPVRGGAALSDHKKCPVLSVCMPPLLGGKNCCPLIQGLLDLDAAGCLCHAVKAVGNIGLDINIVVNLILNTCGRKLKHYTCN